MMLSGDGTVIFENKLYRGRGEKEILASVLCLLWSTRCKGGRCLSSPLCSLWVTRTVENLILFILKELL